jgi:hypothetical protein
LEGVKNIRSALVLFLFLCYLYFKTNREQYEAYINPKTAGNLRFFNPESG